MSPHASVRLFCAAALLAGATNRSAVLAGPVRAPDSPAPSVLARIPALGGLEEGAVPVYARLQGADGSEYVLAFASRERVAPVPSARVLAAGGSPDEFVVGLERRRGARAKAPSLAEVVLDDGRHVVARATAAQAEALSAAGFDLLRLPAVPMDLARRPAPIPLGGTGWDATIAGMVAEVTEPAVADLAGGLSGDHPVSFDDGSSGTIFSRHTTSGPQLDRATRYAWERLRSFGLAPAYHDWQRSSYSGRNVVADLPGALRPSEVVLLCAHLDDMPPNSVAPGADDNASGASGVLLAARVLSAHRFERTIRFALFTGEEQGLLGSAAYAELLASQGADVVAVLNLDMIGFDGTGGPILRLHTRTPGNAGYAADLAIAGVFRAAVTDYVGASLAPVDDPDGLATSDHSSFWSRGWPGILAIEDDVSDFNPWYHTSSDTVAALNLSYFASFVKAAVATTARLGVLSTAGTAFYALTPCRVLDTRDSARPAGLGPPALSARLTRTFNAGTACGIPAGSAALAVNVTVTGPSAAGFVTLFPGSSTAPAASTVHFRPGVTRASASVIAVGAGATFSVSNASDGTAHLVVDVVGVFR